MVTVLISGATGFVGKNLIPHLTSKDIAVDILKLRDDFHEQKLADCDVIVHLAGKAHDLKKNVNAEEYYQVNYELTKKLYDAFLKSAATKFIFVSSVKASTDSVEGILTEDSTPKPKTHYGKSKLIAEEYIMDQTLPEGKLYYILRPCMIHGPGNKGNLNLLYKVVQKGIPYPLAAFSNKRSFLSIQNLNFVIEKLIVQDIRSGIYNVSDDKSLSTNRVILLIGETLNFKARLWKINPALIRLLARMGDVLRLPLDTDRLQKLTESYEVSNKKIKTALSIDELPVSAENGLVTTIKSFGKK